MMRLLLAGLLFSAPAALAAEAGESERLRVCLASHNMPMSTSHEPWGIEGELALSLGSELGRAVEFVWIPPEEETPEAALRGNRCDAAMGAIVDPGSMAVQSGVPGLALTAPYYSAGYMLLHRPGSRSPTNLSDIADQRIAVEMVSIPIYTLKQQGYKVLAVDETGAVIDAVANGRAPYGYVWGPVGAFLVRDRDDVALAERFEPPERWEFALAVREHDTALRNALNSAISAALDRGDVARIFEEYNIPYSAPAGRDGGGADQREL